MAKAKIKLKKDLGNKKAGKVYEVDSVKAASLEKLGYATKDLKYKVVKKLEFPDPEFPPVLEED
jgi:hypothetical protein